MYDMTHKNLTSLKLLQNGEVIKYFLSHFCLTDPSTERHKLVHNGGFPKLEVLYKSQNTVKSIKIQ